MPVWLGRLRSVCLAVGSLAMCLFWLGALALPASPASVPGARGLWPGVEWLLAPLALTFAAQRLLRHSSPALAGPRSYRLAFLAGAGLGVALWAYQGLAHGGVPWWGLGAVLLGAFAGGLAVTALEGGLWEDSYPPPPQVADAVRQQHLRTIGRPAQGPRSKRLFDLGLAAAGLIVTAPVWLLCLFLVWFEDPGPVLFVKNSVGRGGANFRQVKMRSMVRNAEAKTGPVASRKEGDPRVLRVGRYLRKTALDELPQLLNILRGEMSFVGPRPLRTVVIHGYLQSMPQFAERHRVRPGIAGLSQVRGGYYVTPLQRLRFDRIYVRHMSLRLDLMILLQALLIVLLLRWLPGTRREKIRRWASFRSSRPRRS